MTFTPVKSTSPPPTNTFAAIKSTSPSPQHNTIHTLRHHNRRPSRSHSHVTTFPTLDTQPLTLTRTTCAPPRDNTPPPNNTRVNALTTATYHYPTQHSPSPGLTPLTKRRARGGYTGRAGGKKDAEERGDPQETLGGERGGAGR